MYPVLYTSLLYRNRKIKPFNDGFVSKSAANNLKLELSTQHSNAKIDAVLVHKLFRIEEDAELVMDKHLVVFVSDTPVQSATPFPSSADAALQSLDLPSKRKQIMQPTIERTLKLGAFKPPLKVTTRTQNPQDVIQPQSHSLNSLTRSESNGARLNHEVKINSANSSHYSNLSDSRDLKSNLTSPNDLRVINLSSKRAKISRVRQSSVEHNIPSPDKNFLLSNNDHLDHDNPFQIGLVSVEAELELESKSANPIEQIPSPVLQQVDTHQEHIISFLSDKSTVGGHDEAFNELFENVTRPPTFQMKSNLISAVLKPPVFKEASFLSSNTDKRLIKRLSSSSPRNGSRFISIPASSINHKIGSPKFFGDPGTTTANLGLQSQKVYEPPMTIGHIPKHCAENLYFRNKQQCSGISKSGLKRTLVIPGQFDSVDDYKTTFKKAILEHLQVQLDSLAMRFHQSAGSSFHQKVHAHPATIAIQSSQQYSFQNMPDIKTTKHFIVCLESPIKNIEISKDDIWIISPTNCFETSTICKSVHYGTSGSTTLELVPFSSHTGFNVVAHIQNIFTDRRVGRTAPIYVIHAGNYMTDLLTFSNLDLFTDSIRVKESIMCGMTARANDRFVGVGVDIGAQLDRVLKVVAETVKKFGLNRDQERVVERVGLDFSESVDGIRIVHGVFGAGKTYLIAVIIIFLFRAAEDGLLDHIPNFRIVISSMSNVAVDQILSTLLNLGFTDFVRVGSIKKISKTLLPYTLQQLKNGNEELRELKNMFKSEGLDAIQRKSLVEAVRRFTANENRNLVDTAFVIGVTCAASAFESLNEIEASLLILDECSQMTEPLSLLPILRFNPSNVLIIGDPRQLSPTLETLTNNSSTSLDRTLYDRIAQFDPHGPVMLRTQYRCHEKIAGISNRLFYGGTLIHGAKEEHTSSCVNGFSATVFVNVSRGGERRDGSSNGGGSLVNLEEVDCVLRIVKLLVELHDVEPGKIGVVTFYKTQAQTLHRKLSASSILSGIQVNTVDSFQGGEKDVILISTVRTDEIGFIDEPKRVNVAITRARRHLIVVGRGGLLVKNRVWREIVDGMEGMEEQDMYIKLQDCGTLLLKEMPEDKELLLGDNYKGSGFEGVEENIEFGEERDEEDSWDLFAKEVNDLSFQL